jgi:hypothetical protein
MGLSGVVPRLAFEYQVRSIAAWLAMAGAVAGERAS